LNINTEVFQIILRYGPPRKSCEDRLKRSGLTTLESRRYNWSHQLYHCIFNGKEALQLERFLY